MAELQQMIPMVWGKKTSQGLADTIFSRWTQGTVVYSGTPGILLLLLLFFCHPSLYPGLPGIVLFLPSPPLSASSEKNPSKSLSIPFMFLVYDYFLSLTRDLLH